MAEVQGTAAQNVVPIEDLMDATIDDLKDLPPFILPPKGHYKLLLGLERKSINDRPAIIANFVVEETMELSNKADIAVEKGTKFNQVFFMDNEFGQGAFKLFMSPVSASMGWAGKKISELCNLCQNVHIAATLKHKKDKEDAEKFYPNVVNPEVV